MRAVVEPSRETPVVAEVDVLVAGGGPSGVAAAVAAGRLGARTLLLERYGCLGGLATGGLVLHLMAMFDAAGRRWIGGLAAEAAERLAAMGGLAHESPTRPHADSELLKVVYDRMCAEAGVDLRLHSWAVSALVEGGAVRGAVVESKAGRQAVLAKACVDATGDADLAASAGAGCRSGTMAIGLPLKIGGVDIDSWRRFEREEPDHARELVERVKAAGGYRIRPRPTPWSDAGVYWVNINGLARRAKGAEANSTDRLEGELDATAVEDLSWAEVELRERTLASLDFYRANAPGFDKAHLLAFASQLGVRDSRHVLAVRSVSRADVEADLVWADGVGCVAMDYSTPGHARVPYGCLVPERLEGLLTAGRAIDGDDWVMGTLRLIPPAMVSGQAAGSAAALAARDGVPLRAVDAAGLRSRLERDGVIL
jgi:hypothetical protein